MTEKKETSVPFRKYQLLVYAVLSLAAIPIAEFNLLSIFILPSLPHRCTIPSYSGDTYKIQNESHLELANKWIPKEKVDGEVGYSKCNVYSSSVEQNVSKKTNYSLEQSDDKQQKCDDWVFDYTEYGYTATEQFNVVCSQSSRKSNAQMLYMTGFLIGSIFFGQLSDYIGRKKALLLSILTMLCGGTLSIFPKNFWLFAFVRLIVGMSGGGVFPIAFVIAVELVPKKWRCPAAIMFDVWFGVGFFVLTATAYYVRNWRMLTLAVTLPWLILLTYIWILPESAKWLDTKGKKKELAKLAQRAAKVNKIDEKLQLEEMLEREDEQQETVSLLGVFRSRILCIRILNVFFNWFVNTMVYYGLTLNSGNLGVNVYLSLTISGVADVLPKLAIIWVVQRFGRRWPLFFTMVIGGVSCISTLFIVLYGNPAENPVHNWLMFTLSMIGKCMITASFIIIYVFTIELFPTSARNACLGASSMCARVGGIVSPYVADLATYVQTDFGQALPQLVFGGMSVLAGGLALLLPETKGIDLAATIKESENIGKPGYKASNENGKTDSLLEKNGV